RSTRPRISRGRRPGCASPLRTAHRSPPSRGAARVRGAMAEGAGPTRLAIAWELHQVEHLAPWCELLRMPLLVTDNGPLDAVARAYPGLAVEKATGIAMPEDPPALGPLIAERSPRAIFYSD